MPKIRYKPLRFSPEKLHLIGSVIQIIQEWKSQGYDLTLRGLYYRCIATDIFPDHWKDKGGSKNNIKSYKKLGVLLGQARYAGVIDWYALEDRTRNLSGNSHWQSPHDILKSSADCFMLDKWKDQKYRIEVWVEKDAMEGIIGKAASALDVNYFSCRGYTSLTSIWDAGQRLKQYVNGGQIPVVLHFGDHDPSGLDMSRDIQKRVKLFMDGLGKSLIFKRLALNMDQIRKYNPPPSPAKVTDSRYKKYVDRFGQDCWELDALEPSVVDRLIRIAVTHYRQDTKFKVLEKQEHEHKEHLQLAANNWDKKVTPMLKRIKAPKPKRKK